MIEVAFLLFSIANASFDVSIAGTLAFSRRPVPFVEVKGPGRETAMSGPDGDFVLHSTVKLVDFPFDLGLEAGEWEVDPEAPRVWPEGSEIDLGMIRLRPRVTVRGQVIGEQGVPVVGASVWVISTGHLLRRDDSKILESPPTVYSDGAGLFEVTATPEFSRLWVEAWANGFVPAGSTLRHPAPGVHELELRLERAACLDLAVRDDAGEPIEGIYIDPTNLRRGGSSSWLMTDSEGMATLRAVPEGLLVLEFFGAGVAGESRRLQVEASSDGRCTPIRLNLSEPIDVEGLVVDHEGVPLPRVQVSAQPLGAPPTGISRFWSSGATDGNGRFFLDGLGKGQHRILADSATHGRKELVVELQRDEEFVKIELDTPPVELSGAVISTRGEGPPGVLFLTARSGRVHRVWIGPDGSFQVFLVPGEYRLSTGDRQWEVVDGPQVFRIEDDETNQIIWVQRVEEGR